MNKGLPNGHANCLLSTALISGNNNAPTNLILPSTTTISTSSTNNLFEATPTQTLATMRLLSGNNKDHFTQHLLLFKSSAKPENGQRLDLTNLQLPTVQNGSSSDDARLDEYIDCSPVVNNQSERTNNPQSSTSLTSPDTDKLMSEQEASQQQQLSSVQPTNESVEALPEGDNMNYNQESKSQSSPKSYPKPLDINSQQLLLQQQTKRLMKRIKRLQIIHTQRHGEKQLKHFVEEQQTANGIQCQRNDRTFNAISASFSQNYPQVNTHLDDRTTLLTREGVKGLSTSALVNLVRKLESSGGVFNDGNRQFCHFLPSSRSSHPKQPPESPATTTVETPAEVKCQESTLVKLLRKSPDRTSQETLNSEEVEPLSTAIGTVESNLSFLESGYDSDVTDSSSGGESCDDFEEYESDFRYSNLNTDPGRLIPIHKRSVWKWTLERGAIASRWTWLQAQVADYEFKIRQQNEMYRQLRATKGVISFGVPSENKSTQEPSTAPVTNTVNNTSTTSTTSTTTTTTTTTTATTTTANGSTTTNSSTTTTTGKPLDTDHPCVRTMPLNGMRKRKLVRSMSALSGATRKAAKFSTVQCACNGLPDMISPCVLCNGRYNYVQVIDTDCMPLFERVALLDSSCHPVLSLHNDICLGLHFSELLKRETIQKPINSRQQNKKRKSPPSPTIGSRFGFDVKSKSPKRSQAVISSTKLKKKYDGTNKRKYTRRPLGGGDNSWRKRGRPRERSSSGSSRTESPIPSPAPSENSVVIAPLNRRRRSEQQYDINNIVIPYSIAATTRVEKLQYKEILTPKWRVYEISDLVILKANNNCKLKDLNTSNDECTNDNEEDISDTAFEMRHNKCEVEEKKRILSFLKGSSQHGHIRRGARVRMESGRAESVGSNASVSVGDGLQNFDTNSQDSFLPATPIINASSHNDSTFLVQDSSPAAGERRRTISSSNKKDDLQDDESNSETIVQPFETRNFPISDSEYEILLNQTSFNYDSFEEESEHLCDQEKSNEGTITANTSRAQSPVRSDGSEAVEHAEEAENDDNPEEDPEWEPKN